jgi:Arc/MetJ-type ribon-helix-helix transcriptional regulator
MRTIIQLPDELLKALDRVAKARRLSRAEVIRQAIARHLEQEGPAEAGEAFALWRDRKFDALAYEDTLRAEWTSGSGRRRTRARSFKAS